MATDKKRIEEIIALTNTFAQKEAIVVGAMRLLDEAQQLIRDDEKELSQLCVKSTYDLLDKIRILKRDIGISAYVASENADGFGGDQFDPI